MALTLIKNKTQNIFIVFSEINDGIICCSQEVKIQKIFILAALEKYKQITFVEKACHLSAIPQINKHYEISEDSITIQRSFLKFFKERLLTIEESSLSYSLIIKCLE